MIRVFVFAFPEFTLNTLERRPRKKIKMAHTFQQEYMEMPPITRAYTTACVLTTIAVVFLFLLYILVLQTFQIKLKFYKRYRNSCFL